MNDFVREALQDICPVVLLFDRELGMEGHEVLSRPRQQVPIQHLTEELHDYASAVRQQIIAAVPPGRAFHDLPGQGTRLCGAWREARHGGETGRGHKVVLQDELAAQLLPRFRVVLALHPLQELGNAINLESAVVHLCPVHHLGIEPSQGGQERPGLPLLWRHLRATRRTRPD
ncbi:hypothetical protein ACWGF2_20560 [Streptomyces sp. NPDC054919]